MNFFQAQDRTRRNTLLLVLLFTTAVVLTVVLTAAIIYYAVLFSYWSDGKVVSSDFDKTLLITIPIGVLAFISLASLAKVLALSGGGGKVAEALDGRLVLPATRDPAERQLLNIVEEMAIAAGAPIPDVYLLPDQHINAFAAGTKPSNAAIGVTRGCMTLLSRDQLQGVIAHEFSHIMNGDMRLNIRLIAIINGLMLIGYIGYFLVRHALYSSALSNSRDDNRGGGGLAMVLFGLALIVAGYVGTFFGGWIRAAVSRQREFLADAAAVQYTRQSTGIAGALERIGELSARGASGKVHGASTMSRMFQDKDSIGNYHAIEYSHMFFSNAVHVGFANPFATHPPLQQRIVRLMPGWSPDNPINTAPLPAAQPHELPRKQKPGQSNAASAAAYSGLFDNPVSAGAAGIAANTITNEIGTLNAASIEQATKIVENIPPVFARAAEDPYSARALIYVMLLDRKNEDIRNNQLAHLHQRADTGIYDMTKKLMPDLAILKPAAKLPLVQLTLPALRQLSKQQYDLFLNNMDALITADQSVEPFEWCIQGILVHTLHDHFQKKHRRPQGNKSEAMAYALSTLTKISQPKPTAAFSYAIQQAGLQLTYTDDNFDPQRLFDSLQILSTAAPKQKEQFTRAAAECAAFNGQIDVNEAALLRAYFMIIDCPLPLQVAQAA